MISYFQIILLAYILINIITFVIMLLDKIKSRNSDSERISEGLLFFMAVAFGAIGVYAGMFVLRHKTKKWYFLIGIPLVIAQNFSLLYFLYNFSQGNLWLAF